MEHPIRKNGYSGGYQCYNCKDCNRNWTLTKGRAYRSDIRFQALKLYFEGLGFRSIGRILGVSNVTVLKWIRSMGEKLFQEGALWKNTNMQHVAQVHLDEFWHYEAVAIGLKLAAPTRYKVERILGSIKSWFRTSAARYIGLAKTHTQHVLESIAYNLYRAPNIILKGV